MHFEYGSEPGSEPGRLPGSHRNYFKCFISFLISEQSPAAGKRIFLCAFRLFLSIRDICLGKAMPFLTILKQMYAAHRILKKNLFKNIINKGFPYFVFVGCAIIL